MGKIAVITLCTPNLNFKEYTKENSEIYCNKHGYDFLLYEDVIDKNKSAICNKSSLVLENLSKYDWIFMKDADSLFYNIDKKLEYFIDESYRYIGSLCKNGTDVNVGHLFYKCDERTRIEMENINYQIKERILIKGEQRIYNKAWRKSRISPVKVLKKNILNATPLGMPQWNKDLTYHKDFIKENLEKENYEAFSDIDEENTFIVHWMTNFLKTRIVPGKVKFEDIIFEFNDKQLNQFIEFHEKIKKKWGY